MRIIDEKKVIEERYQKSLEAVQESELLFETLQDKEKDIVALNSKVDESNSYRELLEDLIQKKLEHEEKIEKLTKKVKEDEEQIKVEDEIISLNEEELKNSKITIIELTDNVKALQNDILILNEKASKAECELKLAVEKIKDKDEKLQMMEMNTVKDQQAKLLEESF